MPALDAECPNAFALAPREAFKKRVRDCFTSIAARNLRPNVSVERLSNGFCDLSLGQRLHNIAL